MTDYPHITVATVIENNGQFLMVQEKANDGLVFNQPAGHLELGETLAEAAIRETLEETAWRVQLTAFLGIYHFKSQANGITYVRHCFIGKALEHLENQPLDPDITQALWLDRNVITNPETQLRSPLVRQAVTDFYLNPHYPLSMISPCYEK